MNRRSFLLGAGALLATSANVPAADLLVGLDPARAVSDVTAMWWPDFASLPPWQREVLQSVSDLVCYGSSVLHVGHDGVRCLPPEEWPALVNGAPPPGYVVTPLAGIPLDDGELYDLLDLVNESPPYPPRSGA